MDELEERAGFWLTASAQISDSVEVTIVVPTFEAEATLGRALQSVLDQTLRNFEVIVVDDASTDNSWSLICKFISMDSRIRAIRNKENCGKSVGMNRAIALARGRWLALLDADDWYDAARLSALIREGERSQAQMVTDNQYLYDSIADLIVGTAWKPSPATWQLTFDSFLEASNPFASFNLGMLKPVIRTDFLRLLR